jgi:hypothetical protein
MLRSSALGALRFCARYTGKIAPPGWCTDNGRLFDTNALEIWDMGLVV